MNIEEIDQLLSAWEERLRRIDDNLLVLEEDPTYQMLSGTAGHPAPLEGHTRERVRPMLEAVRELFQDREKLTWVLDRAKELRSQVSAFSFWATDDKLSDIERLLCGPSISLDNRPAPLARRSLLEPAVRDVAIEPETLLRNMSCAYEAARNVVAEVSAAWANLDPMLEQLESERVALEQSAKNLGGGFNERGELQTLDRELGSLRARIAMDPLGVQNTVHQTWGPRIAMVREQLAKALAVRNHAEQLHERALELRRALRIEQEKAQQALSRLVCEIDERAEDVPMLVESDRMEGLDSWFSTLQRTLEGQRWSAAQIGLSRWVESAEQVLRCCRVVSERVQALLDARTELAGRFSARKAQLVSLRLRHEGAGVDPSLDAQAREAEALLARRPTPLKAAMDAVHRYEAQVIRLAGQRLEKAR